MVYNREYGYVNLLVMDWMTELYVRQSAAHHEYIRDRTSRGLDAWDEHDERYPKKLDSWLQRTPEGCALLTDLKLREAYKAARDRSIEGGELQRQIFEKALPALEERVSRAAASRIA